MAGVAGLAHIMIVQAARRHNEVGCVGTVNSEIVSAATIIGHSVSVRNLREGQHIGYAGRMIPDDAKPGRSPISLHTATPALQ